MRKLKEIHLAKFETYVRKWQQKLGLQDWEIHVRWVSPSDHGMEDSRAAVFPDANGGIATVVLSQEWDTHTKAGDKELEFIAFHELAHVFLAKLIRTAETYPMMVGGVKEIEEHAVIRKLEYLILGPNPT